MKIKLTNQGRVNASSSVNIALVDLECTCNDDSTFGPHEIIEIGAILGSLSQESFNVISELQIYVRPLINPALTDFCKQLTGIPQSTVNAAITLEGALHILESSLQKNNVTAWASWGKFDCNQFSRECELKLLKNSMAERQHFNVKQLFARKFGHRVGLERALDLRKLTFEGTPHSGLDDARNIARLVAAEAQLREALLKRILPKSLPV
jgi:inhibitor of KinA sporulation pathway (predicted exonuclease)